jgi:hypothetical protein
MSKVKEAAEEQIAWSRAQRRQTLTPYVEPPFTTTAQMSSQPDKQWTPYEKEQSNG